MIRALLFDADGVAVYGGHSKGAFEYELGITPEMTASFFQGPFRDCLVGKADLKQAIALYLPFWGWQGDVDAFLDYWFDVERHVNQPLLDIVKGYREAGIRCYLATNQERYRTEYFTEAMGLAEDFDGIFSSASVGHLKDAPEFFDHVKQQLAPVRPEEMLLWDDGPANIESALKAGLQAELYEGLEAFRARMAKYLTHRP
jgi:putative hydrolase of the HAD superfamily